ncbi:hypothetical protein AHF37_09396 [Paragonimus kellicotti]|nr:hypothetical protein AHF37_09396 [Paragonimus kellicotti]
MKIVHLITLGLVLHTAQNKLCTKEDLHFHTSDCDELGSQWVYKQVKLQDKFCPSGQYLDMENQECRNCSSGYFSKGNALEITKWPEIPAELYVDVSYNSQIINSCNESSWFAKNDYLLGKAKSDCTTLLSMKLHNLHDGIISFTYNIEEYGTMAFFTIRNERCSQLPGSSYMLAYTGYNVFYNMTVKLPKGHHILQWYLFADPNSLQALWGPSESTMKIGQIAVTGTPPILRCTPCPAGTWAATEGQAICDTCPENTFSNTGAQKCEACSTVEYSRPGSTRCITRLPCTNLDYVPVWSPCDSNGMLYKALVFSVVGLVENVPFDLTRNLACILNRCKSQPCYSGFKCLFCIDHNLANKCQPWLLYANFISSGLGTSSQTAAILELSLPFGFVRSTEDNGDEGDLIVRDPPIPDTHLRVEFEMVCSALCQLVLKQSQEGQRDVEVMSWYAGQKRQNYTSQQWKFYWIFEKNVAKDTKDLAFLHDHVRIYQIEVTNAKKLSVIGCRTCLKGVKNGKQVIKSICSSKCL